MALNASFKQYVYLQGLDAIEISGLDVEHLVPEQQFSTEDEPAEGVSAIAAIVKAQAEGQRVFYITQDNLNEVMAEISISQALREDIQRAVSQFGYEAIVHEAPITVPGWRGSGYTLI